MQIFGATFRFICALMRHLRTLKQLLINDLQRLSWTLIYIYIYFDSKELLFCRCTVHMMHFSLTPDIMRWSSIHATPLTFFFSPYDDWRTFINHWSSPFIVTKNSGKPPLEATSCLLQHLSTETGTLESWPRASTSIQTNAVACFHQTWINLVLIYRKQANKPTVLR